MTEQEAMKRALRILAHKAQYWADGDYAIPLMEDPRENRLVCQAFDKLATELDERADQIDGAHQ